MSNSNRIPITISKHSFGIIHDCTALLHASIASYILGLLATSTDTSRVPSYQKGFVQDIGHQKETIVIYIKLEKVCENGIPSCLIMRDREEGGGSACHYF